jgi:hypothetical protein
MISAKEKRRRRKKNEFLFDSVPVDRRERWWVFSKRMNMIPHAERVEKSTIDFIKWSEKEGERTITLRWPLYRNNNNNNSISSPQTKLISVICIQAEFFKYASTPSHCNLSWRKKNGTLNWIFLLINWDMINDQNKTILWL